MTKKISKKTKGAPSRNSLPIEDSVTMSVRAPSDAQPLIPGTSTRVEMPPPEVLLEEAEQEPNYRDLRSYCAVIGTLRRKGFSYRDIAEWLSERGFDADHNAVYRVYTNSLSDAEARMEDDEEELEARLEAQRNH